MVKRRKTLRKRFQKKYTRKIRGGTRWSLEKLEFKYTKDPMRMAWTRAIHPLKFQFIDVLKSIPWKTYEFQGKSDIVTSEENERDMIIYKTFQKNIHAECWDIPYSLFGGSACEFWNEVYPEAGNLYDTTDPTGDFDVALNNLNQTSKEVDDDFSDMYVVNGTYTPLIDNYTKWIIGKLSENLVELNNSLGDNFLNPEKDDTGETARADYVVKVGKFLICRILQESMIKIQVIVKIKYEPPIMKNSNRNIVKNIPDQYNPYKQTVIADHCMEFILLYNQKLSEKYKHNSNSLSHGVCKQNGLYVKCPTDILLSPANGQIKGLIGRLDILEQSPAEKYKNLHKLQNHYGRVLYLTKLIRYCFDHGILNPNILNVVYVSQLMKPVLEGAFDKTKYDLSNVCIPPRCSAYEYLKPLKPYLEKYKMSKVYPGIKEMNQIFGWE
jgi:hypothetical protein